MYGPQPGAPRQNGPPLRMRQPLPTQQRAPINMASSNPNQQIYSAPINQFMMPNQQQQYQQPIVMQMQTGQPQVMYQPRMPYTPLGNSQGTYSNTVYQQAQVSQPGPAVYYNQGVPIQQSQRPLAPAAGAQAYSKRERKAIPIIDPKTGRDIVKEDAGAVNARSTPPQAGSSGTRSTPVGSFSMDYYGMDMGAEGTPPSNNEIAAQFAAQVAKAIGDPNQVKQASLRPQVVMAAPPGANLHFVPSVNAPVFEPQQPPLEQRLPLGGHIPVPPASDLVVEQAEMMPAEYESGSVVTTRSDTGAVEVHIPADPADSPQHFDADFTEEEHTPKELSPPQDLVDEEDTVSAEPDPSETSMETLPPEARPATPDTQTDLEPKHDSDLQTPAESVIISDPQLERASSEEAQQLVTVAEPEATPQVFPQSENMPPVLVEKEPSPPVLNEHTPEQASSGNEEVLPPADPPVDSQEEGRGRRRPSKQRSQEGTRHDSRDRTNGDTCAKELHASAEAEIVQVKNASKPPLPPAVAQPVVAPTEVETNNQPEELVQDSPEEVPQVVIKVEDSKVSEENARNTEKSQQAKNSIDKPDLKYEYKEDQWSPLNPEGKKSYDREFLLKLQFASESLAKPTGLPQLPDVVMDKPQYREGGGQSMPPPRMRNRHDFSVPDFTPGYVKSSPGVKNMGSVSMGRRSQDRGGRGRPDQRNVKVITHVSISKDIELHHTENAWKPQHRTDKPSDPEEAKTQEILRKVRSILNKLTPQKFQTLVQQVLDLGINTEDRLQGTIAIIFEKAIDEPSFSVAYANMCKVMINMKVPQKAKPDEFITFRKILLTRCQHEFEKDKAEALDLQERQKAIDEATTEEKKKELEILKEEAEAKAKRRSIGNIRFIGELFKLKMLTENIMHDCLFKLLKTQDEDNLECLCRLLTTIGKDIDHEKAKQRVDQYFERMQKIVDERQVSSRCRFMLQDVIELRRNGWVPRREDNNPKTIDQIHKEAARESAEKMFMLQKAQTEQKSKPRSEGRGPRFQQKQQQGGEDGWMPVGKQRPVVIDPAKLKLTKPSVDENIQLGPGGRGFTMGGWGKGSSGGFRPPSQEADRPPAPANRFTLLSGGSQPDSGDGRGRGIGRGGPPGRDRGRNIGPRGRNMARVSQEQERESALQAAKNIVQGQGGGRVTPSGSRNQSREGSRNREAQEAPPVVASKELTEEEVEAKAKAILEEFLHIHDMKEAVLCVKELQSPSTIHAFVTHTLNSVMERSEQARKQAGTLLHELVKQGVLTEQQYIKGLKSVLEFAEDIAIDVPKIWDYIGDLMGYVCYDGVIPMASFQEPLAPLLQGNHAGKVMACLLHHVSHNMGHIKAGEMWSASGLKWSDFLPSSVDEKSFIKDNKVEFTLEEEVRSPEARALPMEQVVRNLERLITEQKASNEDVFDWVAANVPESRLREPPFIRALMTAVCSSAISGSSADTYKLEPGVIEHRAVLLQRYLDHSNELELQALYALQALVHRLQHPAGLLRQFFDSLYDEDVISEDAFTQWESSSDPAEQTGKGPAIMASRQFFTWLKNAEPEES